mgnify:FL=1
MKKYIDALKQYAQNATTSDPKTGACWEGYQRVPNTKKGDPGSCEKIGSTKADKDPTISDAKTGACWEGYERVPDTKKGDKGSCRKIKAEESKADYKYQNPKTGEVFIYSRRDIYKKDGVTLIYKGKAEKTESAEYQGRKVTLNKPFLTPDGPKKRSVYVKNEKGNVVKVNFGDPNMRIKKNDPARRKSFRARHNCDNPGPKWKARYWSCKAW